jgi:predicted GIY-YIG superfamily endonuclease
MAKKGRRPRAKVSGDCWFVYMVRCADDSIYTGIAKDVARRCQQHNAGTASHYTHGRLPVVVVYEECQRSRSLALKREAAIKAMNRQQKLALIGSYNLDACLCPRKPEDSSSESPVAIISAGK